MSWLGLNPHRFNILSTRIIIGLKYWLAEAINTVSIRSKINLKIKENTARLFHFDILFYHHLCLLRDIYVWVNFLVLFLYCESNFLNLFHTKEVCCNFVKVLFGISYKYIIREAFTDIFILKRTGQLLNLVFVH